MSGSQSTAKELRPAAPGPGRAANPGPLRIGLVGCGRLAELGYLPALARTRAVQVVGVADPHPHRRQRLAERTGAVADVDAAAMLERGHVDAIVLATPAETHLADARLATAARVPVLIEKPPAARLSEAVELARLEPSPWVAFNRRFAPGRRELRDALAGKRVAELELALHYRRRSWNAYTVADDALLDLGPHLIDLARWLCGPVTRVRALRVTHHRAALELELERGRAQISCATDRLHRERLDVRDGRGAMKAADRANGLAGGLLARLHLRRREHPLAFSLGGQLGAFARAARGGAEPSLGTARDGVAVMAVMDAARRSDQRRGAWVGVEGNG